MSPRLSTLIILLILVHLLAACAPHKADSVPPPVGADAAQKPTPPQQFPVEIPRQQATPPANVQNYEWVSNAVSITCSLSSCPAQVGAIFLLEPTKGSEYFIYRCTAFLVAADRIMTNGHCDVSSASDIFFSTRTDAPERAFRRVVRRVFETFTANKDNAELSSGRPDVAVYQLESPVTNIQPLTLASGKQREYSSLTAIVANSIPGKDDFNLSIGKVECPIRRHERFFPYNLSEAPDMIRAFDCQSIKGNSGSPMFADGNLNTVEAILQGGGDLEKAAEKARKDEGRDLVPFEKHRSVLATNARCIDYPVKHQISCLEATDAAMSERFKQSQLNWYKDLNLRPAPGGPYQTAFKVLGFDIKSGNKVSIQGAAAELMYMPKCRTAPTVSNLTVPSEHIKITFDEWAQMQTETTGTAFSTGTINQQTPANIKIDNMNWSQPFGEYEKPDGDLRKQLGKSFSIALPACSS